MPRRIPRLVWLALPLAYLLYFYHLDGAGLVGPDEPRYAAVGQEMARSGDWVTPRLWGEAWFEKPALLYWTSATGFRAGLGPELAPRLPVALAAVLFLALFAWVVGREFGGATAAMASLILGTCWGWVGYSQIAVTDLLLTAMFSAAMLLALPWIGRSDARPLPATGAFLGLAVLAKGLVPLVLAAPLLSRGRIRDLLRVPVMAAFLVVALPWYVLCYVRNGNEFLNVFFWQHHVSRFFSGGLMHLQSVWFYVPVLLAGMLPWSPLLLLLVRRGAWKDPRRVFLLLWIVWGLIFFSISANKLPGYILPLFPALAVLMALRLNDVGEARPWLAACAVLLAAFPVAAQVLPAAVADGLSRAAQPRLEWTWLLPVAVAAAVWVLRDRRVAATLTVAVCATAGFVYLKTVSVPELDRMASARGLWRKIEARAGHTCVAEIQRAWRYGLNYYSVAPLPDCDKEPRPLEIRQTANRPPHLAAAKSGGHRDAELGVPGDR
ncbi:MAG TPA: glycosyltransferase family 39 protein [Bryobacteraceae bacterium]|nr:glycosyltransferase family 39 protein [Bryobacteraceae bacterium]